MDSNRTLHERRKAQMVAQELVDKLRPVTERIEIAGSLRRERSHVKDIEILFIPQIRSGPADLFGQTWDNEDLAHALIHELMLNGYLAMRKSIDGKTCWGLENKLAIHVPSGIPVDFFATTADKWWNSLVVRTGGKRSNLQLTMAANKRGWCFEAYGSGFRRLDGSGHQQMFSEQEIFHFVDLPYREPVLRP